MGRSAGDAVTIVERLDEERCHELHGTRADHPGPEGAGSRAAVPAHQSCMARRKLGLSLQRLLRQAPTTSSMARMRLLEEIRRRLRLSLLLRVARNRSMGRRHDLLRKTDPPLCGAPVIHRPEDIDRLQDALQYESSRGPACACWTAIAGLKATPGKARVPIIAVAISPFSLPVMQMGFDRYIELMHEQPDRFRQADANSTRSSPSIGPMRSWPPVPRRSAISIRCPRPPTFRATLYLDHRPTGGAARALPESRVRPPPTWHPDAACPSSPTSPTPAPPWSASAFWTTCAQLKAPRPGRVSLLGNLNGIEMRRWTPADAELAGQARDRRAPAAVAASSSADNHGEIPWQVSDETLLAIREAVEPLGGATRSNWVEGLDRSRPDLNDDHGQRGTASSVATTFAREVGARHCRGRLERRQWRWRFPARCGRPPVRLGTSCVRCCPEDCGQLAVFGRACLQGLADPPAGFPPMQVDAAATMLQPGRRSLSLVNEVDRRRRLPAVTGLARGTGANGRHRHGISRPKRCARLL
jgi:uroporphyrinogen decarboxylase